MATLQDLIDDTRSHLDESFTTGGLWSDAELTRWINEGLRDVARRSENLVQKTDITTTAGTQEYSAAGDTLRIHRMEWSPDSFITIYPLEGRGLFEMDQVWGTNRTSQNTPKFFAIGTTTPGALQIILYPVPSTTGKLRVYYYRLPTTLVLATPTGVAEIAAGWEDLIPLYAEMVAKRKDADRTWSDAKALYDERLAHHMETTRTWHDQVGMITTGNNWLPSWLVGDYG